MKGLIKYFSIVFVAFIFDFSFLFLIDLKFSFNRNILSIFSYLLGLLVCYILLKKYVYSNLENSSLFEISSFLLSGIAMSLITGLIFYITDFVGVENIFYQKITASMISFTTLFIIRNYFIFAKK